MAIRPDLRAGTADVIFSPYDRPGEPAPSAPVVPYPVVGSTALYGRGPRIHRGKSRVTGSPERCPQKVERDDSLCCPIGWRASAL